MRRIDENSEVIRYMSYILMIIGWDEQSLEKSCMKFKSVLSTLGFKVKLKLLVFQQKKAFKTVSPWPYSVKSYKEGCTNAHTYWGIPIYI